MGLTVKGLMDDGSYPRSRDHVLDNFICKRKSCVANRLNTCICPSLCVIDEYGKCEGYKERIK